MTIRSFVPSFALPLTFATPFLRRGRRFVRSTLNWGPVDFINSAGLTSGWWTRRRQDFSDDFHTFVLEWTPEFLNCYVDSPRNLMLGLKFDKPFYERGNYPGTAQNGTNQVILKDPWAISGANSAPFDKDFYLIMNVAVGGRNGWFPDTLGGKMWFDGSDSKTFRANIVMTPALTILSRSCNVRLCEG